MLEIVYSGLGLGYHGYLEYDGGRKPVHPLDRKPLQGLQVKFESRVDRALIDISLELRKEDRNLVLSSCTRLPDVISSDRVKYGIKYNT